MSLSLTKETMYLDFIDDCFHSSAVFKTWQLSEMWNLSKKHRKVSFENNATVAPDSLEDPFVEKSSSTGSHSYSGLNLQQQFP